MESRGCYWQTSRRRCKRRKKGRKKFTNSKEKGEVEEEKGGQQQVMSGKRHAMGGRGETDRKKRGHGKGREEDMTQYHRMVLNNN